ncbi:uncharacterized protein MONBRDRAFT_35596 [Monosiga brevicollis MX1]|uniref:PH domain-containing protein n=1 Tax=Monosiga brevicollis TaxID=81824 RepID=A9UQ67_MONBE|nr:uncharacterized protein MONBRDRAFT_35596 [Monosiga brevicollis MX1]EDQ92543.1 predicted protein [Monosiga brevicollis MX1]|eukprot:XP_001742305.1 hypothetical protein [Monosiga brevicollis MX1]
MEEAGPPEGLAPPDFIAGELDERQVLWSGFLTKRGRFRKNWKRRYFELYDNHELAYFKGADVSKPAGKVDLRKCTVVKPGGDCPVTFSEFADPNCCFGIMTRDRQLYLYAETVEETRSWLQNIARLTPENVLVATPGSIAASWKTARPVGSIRKSMRRPRRPETELDDGHYDIRITVYRNGDRDSGRVLSLPTSMDLLLSKCAVTYGVAIARVVDFEGREVEQMRAIKDDAVLIALKPGDPPVIEDTLPPAALHFLRQQSDASGSASATSNPNAKSNEAGPRKNAPKNDTHGDSSSDSSEDEDVSDVLERLNTQVFRGGAPRPGAGGTKSAGPRAAKGSDAHPVSSGPALVMEERPAPAPDSDTELTPDAGYTAPTMRPPTNAQQDEGDDDMYSSDEETQGPAVSYSVPHRARPAPTGPAEYDVVKSD